MAAIQVSEAQEQVEETLHRAAWTEGTEVVVWPEFGGIWFILNGKADELARITANCAPSVTTFEDNHKPLPHKVAGAFAGGKELARYE